MITVFTATKQEAQPLIRKLSLTREKSSVEKPFVVYEGDGIRLIITGIGKINAAAAAGYCLGRFGTDDCYVNCGSAAGTKKAAIGETFFAGQILERSSGREFFPDIADSMYPHCCVITSDKPVTAKETARYDKDSGSQSVAVLFDMEASGIFQVLRNITTPDRIIVIKTVTDTGIENGVNPDFIGAQKLIEAAAEQAASFIRSLAGAAAVKAAGDTDSMTEMLFSGLKCSETMRRQLEQYLRYLRSSGRYQEFMAEAAKLRDEGILPVSDRKHGKELLKQLIDP